MNTVSLIFLLIISFKLLWHNYYTFEDQRILTPEMRSFPGKSVRKFKFADGSSNIFIGNMTGFNNIGIGYHALQSMTSRSNHIAIATHAGRKKWMRPKIWG